jgi:hypothetical protein
MCKVIDVGINILIYIDLRENIKKKLFKKEDRFNG